MCVSSLLCHVGRVPTALLANPTPHSSVLQVALHHPREPRLQYKVMKKRGLRLTPLAPEHRPSVPYQWPCCVHQVAYDCRNLRPGQEGKTGGSSGDVRPSPTSQTPEVVLIFAQELSQGGRGTIRPWCPCSCQESQHGPSRASSHHPITEVPGEAPGLRPGTSCWLTLHRTPPAAHLLLDSQGALWGVSWFHSPLSSPPGCWTWLPALWARPLWTQCMLFPATSPCEAQPWLSPCPPYSSHMHHPTWRSGPDFLFLTMAHKINLKSWIKISPPPAS